jgi:hypothetical protein
VRPGRVLSVTAEILQFGSRDVQLKVQGTLGGRTAVSGRLVLERYNLADTRPQLAPTDSYLRRCLNAQFALIYRPPAETQTTNGSPLIAQLGAAPEPSRGKV